MSILIAVCKKQQLREILLCLMGREVKILVFPEFKQGTQDIPFFKNVISYKSFLNWKHIFLGTEWHLFFQKTTK